MSTLTDCTTAKTPATGSPQDRLEHLPVSAVSAVVTSEEALTHRREEPLIDPPIEYRRYELKILVPPREAYRVTAWLRLHPAGFSTLYPDRRVNSLYFDTPDLTCAQENFAGISRRRKLRLRWYGQAATAVDVTLELKCKEGGLGWKHQVRVARAVDLNSMSWSKLRGLLMKASPVAMKRMIEPLNKPTVLVSYDRSYYQSRDRSVRLTFDRDVTFFDQQFTNRGINFLRRKFLAAPCVIELKSGSCERKRLREIATAFPLRLAKNSKYTYALQTL